MYIHKQELQNNPILICVVRFLSGPQDLALLWKPWDRLWTWMLGQHAGYFTTSFYIYQAQSSQPSLVYQTVNKLPVLISTTNHYPSQHSWVYQAINSNTCTYVNNKQLFLGFISSSEL